MVKIITYFSLLIFMFSCKDAKLIVPKEINSSNKLNLNGYYYLKSSSLPRNTYDVYFLYENGIILYVGSPKSTDEQTISNYINNEILKYNTIYDSKSGWGLYRIINNSIEFESWSVRNAGERIKTVKHNGEIINSNSFKITNIYDNYTKSETKIENVFEFRKFIPKPDSTNKFIK